MMKLEDLKTNITSNISKIKDSSYISKLKNKIKERKILLFPIVISIFLIIVMLFSIKPLRINRLIKSLENNDITVSNKAATKLIKTGKSAVKPLIKVVKHKDSTITIKQPAIKVLAEINNPKSTEFLEKIIKNQDEELVLRELTLSAVSRTEESQSIEILISILENQQDPLVKKAGEMLVNIGKPAVDYLIVAIGDEHTTENSPAGILVRIGEPAVEPLIETLNQENVEKKKSVITVLGEIGDKRAINPIIDLLNKENKQAPEIIDSVFIALSGFRGDEFPELFQLLENNDKDIKIRAVQFFGNEKDPRAVKPLFDFLVKENATLNENATLHKEVFDAFLNIGEPSISAMIASFRIANKDVKVTAAKTLLEMGEPAISKLIISLKDEDYSTRWLSAATLCKVESSPMITGLKDSLKSGNLEIISWAYPFYILLGDSGTDSLLVETIEKLGNSVMAEDFMNSGNEILNSAALKWAAKNGYEVEQQESSAGAPRWGSAK